MADLGFWETTLGAGLAVAAIGWIFQTLRANQTEKLNRLKETELKAAALDKEQTKQEGSIKRLHYRMDAISQEQMKLEKKLEKDMGELKEQIERLTGLVIKALQNRNGDN